MASTLSRLAPPYSTRRLCLQLAQHGLRQPRRIRPETLRCDGTYLFTVPNDVGLSDTLRLIDPVGPTGGSSRSARG